MAITTNELVSCDSCARLFHKKPCSGLNASEIKVMELKGSRQLKFFCIDCQNGLKVVPQLIKAVDELRQEIDTLKRTPVMQIPPIDPVPSGSPMLNEADVLVELQERQKRANNVMLFNVPEGNDTDQVKRIFSIMSERDSPRISDSLRIGKPNKNNSRGLRLTLDSPLEVEKLVKLGHKLKGENVYINFDLTSKERERNKLLLTEFRTRKGNGENVSIRYQNRIPNIVLGKNVK